MQLKELKPRKALNKAFLKVKPNRTEIESFKTNWTGLSVKKHKELKGLKSQNLRDHMSEAELIFTALAELSTRQIAETSKAKGLKENAVASKKGGAVAKNARKELEAKTGKSVVTGENFLPPSNEQKKLK